MRSNKAYTIGYRMQAHDATKQICVLAASKQEAWAKAFYEAIPDKETALAYVAWVIGVTYQNGNYRSF